MCLVAVRFANTVMYWAVRAMELVAVERPRDALDPPYKERNQMFIGSLRISLRSEHTGGLNPEI